MLTSRERVLVTINRKEPDRVPVCPPGGRVNLTPEVKRFLKEFEFDEFVSLNFIRNLDEGREVSPGVYVDDYGCVYRHKGVSEIPYCIRSPLRDAETVREIEEYPKWPDADDPDLILEDARRKARMIREETDHVTTIDVGSIFHRYSWLRGFDKWLMDMRLNPEVYEVTATRICEIRLKCALNLLKVVGEYTDLVQMGDDLGSTTGPFVSVRDFRRFIKPYYERLIREIKREYPHLKFWFHSHGAITRLIPDLIEIGLDVLNPVLPGDNMDPQVLKARFGPDLCFDGGVDVEYILPFGTAEQVEEHVKDVIGKLAPGGGYIFRAQMISNLVSYENLRTAYEAALKYGSYDH